MSHHITCVGHAADKDVTVKCTRTVDGSAAALCAADAESFIVTLTATAASTGCTTSSKSAQAVVSCIPKPDVDVVKVEPSGPVCSDDTSVSASFTLTATIAQTTIKAEAVAAESDTALSDVTCSITSAAGLDVGANDASTATLTAGMIFNDMSVLLV